ncbi:MAG: DUF2500 domain-containing protein [Klebsiella oxytoca]|nr:DUF2500 domain-containing protein [Klebsiella oxytoca]
MSKVPLFFMVAVAIIAVAASYRYVQQRREKMDNDAAPLLQKRVVVSNKMRYEASFRPESGGLEVVFRLQAPQYHALSVGDKGVLSYKGSRFMGFTPEP